LASVRKHEPHAVHEKGRRGDGSLGERRRGEVGLGGGGGGVGVSAVARGWGREGRGVEIAASRRLVGVVVGGG
jgi:hypothetical protein